MKHTEAYDIYVSIKNNIGEYSRSSQSTSIDGFIYSKGVKTVTLWDVPDNPGRKKSYFDIIKEKYAEKNTDKAGDCICTIVKDGVYASLRNNNGRFSVDRLFGFTNQEGYFYLCLATGQDIPDSRNYTIVDISVDDRNFTEKLDKAGIHDDGSNWCLERGGETLKYGSLMTLITENNLYDDITKSGITEAELEIHKYDHGN